MMSWPTFAPTRPRVPPDVPPEPKAAPIATCTYTLVDPDDGPDPAVAVVAEVAARSAAAELGIDPPRICWFQKWSPALAQYRAKYLPSFASLKTWQAEAGEVGRTPRDAPRRILLSVHQTPSQAAVTARHEVAHLGQLEAGLPLDEDLAEAFARGGAGRAA
jgi:hypothetical protein